MIAQTTSSRAIPTPFSNSPDDLVLLAQGAESLLYRTYFLTPSSPIALKYRPPKPWRHPILDRRLTRQRLLAEARTLTKCRREGVLVPGVVGADWDAGWIALEWVDGMTVRACLDRWLSVEIGEDIVRRELGEKTKQPETLDDLWTLMQKIGRAIGKLHNIGVIHGDLTTSNLMLRLPRDQNESNSEDLPTVNGDIVLIDLGLSSQIVQDEDRAVDLYVLERAFGSTHPAAEPLFQEVLREYGESYKGAKAVLKRLDDVRQRGRKKSMIG